MDMIPKQKARDAMRCPSAAHQLERILYPPIRGRKRQWLLQPIFGPHSTGLSSRFVGFSVPFVAPERSKKQWSLTSNGAVESAMSA